MSVAEARKQQLQRQGALQERSVASEAAVAASGSVAGALQRSGKAAGDSSCSVQKRCRSVAKMYIKTGVEITLGKLAWL